MFGLVGLCVMLVVLFVIDDVIFYIVVIIDKDGCCWSWFCVVCGYITVDVLLKNNVSVKFRSYW